jgi:hypothetical protein
MIQGIPGIEAAPVPGKPGKEATSRERLKRCVIDGLDQAKRNQ